ncbi:hypothetical protein ACKFKG_22545 [Phormidesmis sp. 146-35]
MKKAETLEDIGHWMDKAASTVSGLPSPVYCPTLVWIPDGLLIRLDRGNLRAN